MSLGDTAVVIVVAHDWSDPINIVRSFPSRVLPRRSGSEQRIALSHVATERITYRILAGDERDAATLTPLVQTATDTVVRMPRWEDQTRVTTAVSAGVDTVLCDTTDRANYVAGSQAILWRSPQEYEVAEIAIVTTGSLEFTAPLVSDWGAGTIVAPITACRLVEPLALSHWLPTTGALSFTVDTDLTDIAGVGTGGTGVAGVPYAITVSDTLVRPTGRGVITARVTDAVGDELPGDGIIWTSSDPTNAPVVATSDPGRALVYNPNSLISATIPITAELGLLSDTGTAFLT